MDPSDHGHASARSQWATRTLRLVGRPIFQRHPSLRWLAPAGVLGVAAVAATGMFQAGASIEKLPGTTPAALIAAAQAPTASGFSGTVVSRVSLGLPELPSFGGGDPDGSSLASMLAGTHTLQVWYSGADKQRIALLGATDETDLFRNGRDLWHWNSADRVAVHTILPASSAGPGAAPRPDPTSTLTPQALARQALDAIEPSTHVVVHENRRVADRNAYELVLTPRATGTRVGSVHVEVDGQTKVPLGVQVFPRGSTSAAIDVSYTSIRFVQPSETYFRFSPPAGATQRDVRGGSALGRVAERLEHPLGSSGPAGHRTQVSRRVTVTGSGWSTVVGYDSGKPIRVTGALDQALTRASGTWGKGRLLESKLVCVLVTDDGRVYAGAVDPSALYAAARTK